MPTDITTTGHGEKLSRKQEQAIAFLLSEPTIAAAAEKVGVATMTLHRWLKLPAFAEAYQAARRETVGHAITQIQQATSKAVETLLEVMDHSILQAPRVSAARAILEHAMKATELDDHAARLEALEAMMGEKDGKK